MSEPQQVSVVNPANAVTLARLLSIVPFIYFVDLGWRQHALLTILIAGVLDLVDGAVAKLFKCQTPFGEVFDSIADGLLYGSCLIVLLGYGWAPLPQTLGFLGLGALNAAFRFVYARRAGRTTNYQSFAMEVFTGNLAYLIGFAVADYEVSFYYNVCLIVMVVIVLHDTKRMLLDPVPA